MEARIGYADREDTVEWIRLWWPLSDPAALLSAIAADSRFQNVSDAAICEVRVTVHRFQANPGAPTGLGMQWGSLAFDCANNHHGLFDIPGLKPAYCVTTGCFKGLALDTTNSDLVDLAALITAAPALVTPAGDAYNQLKSGGMRWAWNEPTRYSG